MSEKVTNMTSNKKLDNNNIYPFTNDEIFKVVMQDKSIAAEIISIILNKKGYCKLFFANFADLSSQKQACGLNSKTV